MGGKLLAYSQGVSHLLETYTIKYVIAEAASDILHFKIVTCFTSIQFADKLWIKILFGLQAFDDYATKGRLPRDYEGRLEIVGEQSEKVMKILHYKPWRTNSLLTDHATAMAAVDPVATWSQIPKNM